MAESIGYAGTALIVGGDLHLHAAGIAVQQLPASRVDHDLVAAVVESGCLRPCSCLAAR
jgi:hypothetical protein